ncbi:DUF805 domain-containing protein [Zhengella sp. ZM62]|uniref:DUF805 domain-containing protein n=1 Tax=Zhengella sedimenti TaxID=3390035 RepID=UPI003975A4AE
MWRFLGFSGRIGRSTWWLGQLLTVAIGVLAWDDVGTILDRRSDTEPTETGLIALAAILWIGWSTGVKRLHDHNKAATMSNLCCRWTHDVIFELGFKKGDDGPNDFGPPEKPLLRWPSARGGGDSGTLSMTASMWSDTTDMTEPPAPTVKAPVNRPAVRRPVFGRRTTVPR